MFKKISRLAAKFLKGKDWEADLELKSVADKLTQYAATTPPAGTQERIRRLLQAEFSRQQVGENEEARFEDSSISRKAFFRGPRLAYGTLALAAVVLLSLVSYPLLPAPSVQGYAVKNAVREIPYNAPLKIVFSQWMDKGSVEKAFTVEPQIKGRFEWKSSTMLFWPENEFKVGERFTVRVGTEAKSLTGKNLSEEYQEIFAVIAAPELIFYTPAGSDQVGAEAKVTLMFNQPLLKLSTLSEAEKHLPAIKIEPKLEGEWQWLGTAALQFAPKKLPLATTYKVTVPKGIVTANEGRTDKETVFEFSTVAPSLEETSPDRDSGGTYGPDQEIALRFNQKADLDSLRELFTLSVGESDWAYGLHYQDLADYRKAHGDFGVKNDGPETAAEKSEREKTVIVKAKEKFPFATTVAYVLKPGLRGAEGHLVAVSGFKSHFRTADALQVTYLEKNRDYLYLHFNNPVKTVDLKRYARLRDGDKEVTLEADYGNEEEGETHFLDFPARPGKSYTLTVAKGLPDRYGQTLVEDWSETFTVPDLDPLVEIRTNNYLNILDQNLPPELYVKSVNVGKELALSLIQLPESEWPGYSTRATGRGGEFSVEKKVVVAEWKQNLADEKNEYEYIKIDLNRAAGKTLSPGHYLLSVKPASPDYAEAVSGYGYREVAIVLTRSALAIKRSEKEVLVWATDLESGQPVADMEIALKNSTARTDAKGLARIPLPKDTDPYESFAVSGRKGDDRTFAGTDWQEGIGPWNFNLNSSSTTQKVYGYIYTDRPVYRPGDIVYFKGILRADNGRRFLLPDWKTLKVEIEDGQGNFVHNEELKLSANGTFDGKFTLTVGGALGNYTIIAYQRDRNDYANRYQAAFSVAEYRRPAFKVEIAPEKNSVVNGEEIKAEIGADYFFGGALAGAPVEIALLGEDYYFNEFTDEWYNFGDSDWSCYWECPRGGAEKLVGQKASLDDKGKLSFKYTPALKASSTSQIFTLEAVVTDPNSQQQIANRVLLPVHKGGFYVGVRPSAYVFTADDQVKAQIISVDPQGKAVSGKEVKVELKKREWHSVRKQNVDGYYYYENDYKDEPISAKSARTDEKGKAEIAFDKLAGGSYVFVTSANDDKGNKISSSASLYVGSGAFVNWGRDNNDRIELIPDKLDYKAGDNAKILVKSPYAGVKALLTIEKGEVLESRIVDIVSNSQTLTIPIKDEYLPNFYVSVLLVKGGGSAQSVALKLAEAEEELQKATEEQKMLQTEIDDNIAAWRQDSRQLESLNAPLQKRFTDLRRKSEDLMPKIAALKDSAQKLAEVSDNNDGVAAFKLGYAELKVATAEKKLQVALKTDKERYLPGETVKLEIETKNNAGAPVVADVSVAVVDESVLSLKESVVNDLIGYFYQRRFLGVQTAHNLTKFLNRVNVQVQSGLKGGGGGYPGNAETRIRSNFKDTAYWTANLQTDSAGKASTTFKLPDNLTSWQTLAIANTKDTSLGSGKITFKVNKDLSLRPVTPRFLLVNDELEIGFSTRNNTTETIEGRATLVAEGVTLLTETEQPLRVAAGKDALATWKIRVNSGQKARLIFKITDSGPEGLKDEMDFHLPVLPHSLPEFTAVSGTIDKQEQVAQESVFLPAEVEKQLGELQVSVAATFMGSIAQGLEYLVTYPYGCAEQTASSLLPNLAIKQVLNLPQIDNKIINLQDLEEKVKSGLQRLYGFQQAGGGFGVWENSAVSLNLTAYVLSTLDNAKKAGYAVDETVMTRAKNFIQDRHNMGDNLNSLAYASFVLAEVGDLPESMTNNLYDRREHLNLTGKTFLALAMSGNKSQINKAQNLTNFILSQQEATPRGARFSEKNPDYANYDSDAKLNAAVLRLLTRLLPDNPLLDKMLREIRDERLRKNWQDTHASSQTLLALVEYLKKSGELESEFSAKVVINGGEALDAAFFRKENFGNVKTVSLPMEKLLTENQENEVLISRQGSGKLHYDLLLKYYLPLEKLEPRSAGFSVVQNYYDVDDKAENKPLPYLPHGATVKSKITVIVPADRHHVVVEDFLPAGLEAMDFSLKTTARTNREASSPPWENNLWHFNHEEFRDDRVAYFADFLPAGVYELRYFARVTTKGRFTDLPAKVEAMYQPEVFGRATGGIVEAK